MKCFAFFSWGNAYLQTSFCNIFRWCLRNFFFLDFSVHVFAAASESTSFFQVNGYSLLDARYAVFGARLAGDRFFYPLAKTESLVRRCEVTMLTSSKLCKLIVRQGVACILLTTLNFVTASPECLGHLGPCKPGDIK